MPSGSGGGGLFPGAPAQAGGAGTGTVTSVSVTSANGFAGTVATATTTPAITLTTTVTANVLKGNGTAVIAAVAGTDYSAGTQALATGILKSTTGTGALTIASPGTDYPATGVISAGGPTGSGVAVPVITYNANGQLTTVTTSATVGTVAATDATIVVGGTATAPTIQRAALTGDVTTVVNAATLVSTANVKGVVRISTYNVTPQSTTYTAVNGDVVLATAGAGGFTITLPAATINRWVIVKKVDSGAGTITIAPAAGTIDGASTLTITTQYQSYTVIADGTNWWIV